jgi:outer membrane lipoprotein carrier protein
MLKIFLTFFALNIPSASFAKAKPEVYSLLNKTTSRYRSAGLVQAQIEKIVKSEISGTKNRYTGKISLAAGLFRLDQSSPDKSVIVFDGKYLWNEQAAPVDFPGPAQVSKMKIEEKNKSQILFASLLTKEPIAKHFKITSEKVGDIETVYQAEPLKSELPVKKLIIKIKNKDKVVSEISYVDDVENTTRMIFLNTEFKKANAKTFKYQQPQGAQLTEIKSAGEKHE